MRFLKRGRSVLWGLLVGVAALGFGAGTVLGVIVAGGDGTGNGTGVGAGPGWNYVGGVGGASGVFLGNYGGQSWALTAEHVKPGLASSFTFGGTSYGIVAGSVVQLSNPGGGLADLALFRLTGGPDLPALTLAGTTPLTGTTVTMIGNGIGREAGTTRWTAGWSETTFRLLTAHEGYKWSSPTAKRWGTNTVVPALQATATVSFATQFGSAAGNAQATSGDSGGGVFAVDGSLIGIMHAVTGFGGQPGSTSVFGNQTYSADISVYAPQILAIMTASTVPEPGVLALGALAAVAFGLARARAQHCSRAQ